MIRRLRLASKNECVVDFEREPNGDVVSRWLYRAPASEEDEREVHRRIEALLPELFPGLGFEPGEAIPFSCHSNQPKGDRPAWGSRKT